MSALELHTLTIHSRPSHVHRRVWSGRNIDCNEAAMPSVTAPHCHLATVVMEINVLAGYVAC